MKENNLKELTELELTDVNGGGNPIGDLLGRIGFVQGLCDLSSGFARGFKDVARRK